MKEFNDLLKTLGITRKEFAEGVGITYKSMGAMLVKSKPVPKWALSALIVAKQLKVVEENEPQNTGLNERVIMIEREQRKRILELNNSIKPPLSK